METNELREYAWHWFEYHAGQRLTEFRYFLIFFGALAVGFSKSIDNSNFIIASIICWFGVFISFAFLMLDCRNQQLVTAGRDALEHLEQTDNSMKREPKLQLIHNSQNNRRSWVSHSFWFRLIYGVCILLFVIGAFNPKIALT